METILICLVPIVLVYIAVYKIMNADSSAPDEQPAGQKTSEEHEREKQFWTFRMLNRNNPINYDVNPHNDTIGSSFIYASDAHRDFHNNSC